MKRTCKYIIGDGKRSIYVDEENAAEIMAYLYQDDRHRKKFVFISDIIFGGHKNPDVYDKETISDKCKDVTAMKFFKGQENDRIYCKEIHTDKGLFVVIMAILYKKKKTTKLNREQKNLIEKVASYTYEI